jgi:hypothetical protein
MSPPEFKADRILPRQKLLDDEIKQDNGQEGQYFLNVFQHESNIAGFERKCNGGWILAYGSSIYPRF